MKLELFQTLIERVQASTLRQIKEAEEAHNRAIRSDDYRMSSYNLGRLDALKNLQCMIGQIAEEVGQ